MADVERVKRKIIPDSHFLLTLETMLASVQILKSLKPITTPGFNTVIFWHVSKLRVSNLINDLVPNNKQVLCFKPQARLFFIPDTPLLLFPLPLYSIFSTFSSPFNHIPSGLSCCFEWGREGRGERKSSQFQCIPPWFELLCSGSSMKASYI